AGRAARLEDEEDGLLGSEAVGGGLEGPAQGVLVGMALAERLQHLVQGEEQRGVVATGGNAGRHAQLLGLGATVGRTIPPAIPDISPPRARPGRRRGPYAPTSRASSPGRRWRRSRARAAGSRRWRS